jgi:hypothetical protein
MNALIDQWGARNVGIAMMVVAFLALIAAVLIGWEAFQRGMGILALDRAQAAALTDDRQATIANGREAAAWLPAEPAAGIIAIDLSDPAAKEQLARLELRVPAKQRPTVAAINALHQIHHGGKPGSTLTGGDQAIINHLLKLAQGKSPEALTLPDSDPPQATLLNYAAQVRFRAAWNIGEREAIRATAGELRLLMPKHPDIKGVEAVLLALTPSVADEALRSQLNVIPRGARRDLVLLKLMSLAPEREAVIKPLLPTTGPTTGAGK